LYTLTEKAKKIEFQRKYQLIGRLLVYPDRNVSALKPSRGNSLLENLSYVLEVVVAKSNVYHMLLEFASLINTVQQIAHLRL
jgi:hypothetical protein